MIETPKTVNDTWNEWIPSHRVFSHACMEIAWTAFRDGHTAGRSARDEKVDTLRAQRDHWQEREKETLSRWQAENAEHPREYRVMGDYNDLQFQTDNKEYAVERHAELERLYRWSGFIEFRERAGEWERFTL